MKKKVNWTKEEEQILKEKYFIVSKDKEELQKLLPGRTLIGIRHKARKLGLYFHRSFSKKEEELAMPLLKSGYSLTGGSKNA